MTCVYLQRPSMRPLGGQPAPGYNSDERNGHKKWCTDRVLLGRGDLRSKLDRDWLNPLSLMPNQLLPLVLLILPMGRPPL